MLYLIGTGLYYLNDMPLRAIDILKKADEIFLERYTNINDISFLSRLEKLIEKKILIVDRETIESDELIDRAINKKVVLLVPGDPLFATTHISLIIECKRREIEYKVIHASSIISSIGETGLLPYKFGAVSSIPLFYENFKPTSFFDVIEKNQRNGMHSLVLLEYKSKDEFVDPDTAINIIKNISNERRKVINLDNSIVISKLGSDQQRIVFYSNKKDKLEPPFSIVIPGGISEIEKEAISILIEH